MKSREMGMDGGILEEFLIFLRMEDIAECLMLI